MVSPCSVRKKRSTSDSSAPISPTSARIAITLDPLAGGIARFDDAGPRGPDLVETGQHLGMESLVLQGQSGGGTHRVDMVLVLPRGGVVDQGANGAAGAFDPRDHPEAAGLCTIAKGSPCSSTQ